MFNVPVLLILYNRIEETHKVFQILRAVQPSQLFVAGDGALPNDPIDRKHTYQARSVIQPEWPCDMQTLWQEAHLGRDAMIDTAMKWFFNHVQEGIILFEDTLPSYDFFPYCQELLERYRNNEQIYSIGGAYLRHNSRKRYQKRLRKGKSSYYFSCYGTNWGFATWKNRWADFTLSMEQYSNEDIPKILSYYMHTQKQKIYWNSRFSIIKKSKAKHWHYQILLYIWAHKGLCITPYLNLTTNIGFSQNSRKMRRLRRNSYPIMPLNHPDEVFHNYKEDAYTFKHIFNKAFIRLFKDWLSELRPNKIDYTQIN